MATRRKFNGNSGLTLIECLVVLAIIVLLAGFLLPVLANARVKHRRVNCINNLKQTTLGFGLYAGEHDGKFPIQISTNLGGTKEWVGAWAVFKHFQVLSNEIGSPKILFCPADSARTNAATFAAIGRSNLSYWIDQYAQKNESANLLLGDRNLALNTVPLSAGSFLVATQQSLTWSKATHEYAGNISFCDGSTRSGYSHLLEAARLQQSIATNWLAIP
jgi:prepilin-type N-terminal cleavage/methylation domain-containing protein